MQVVSFPGRKTSTLASSLSQAGFEPAVRNASQGRNRRPLHHGYILAHHFLLILCSDLLASSSPRLATFPLRESPTCCELAPFNAATPLVTPFLRWILAAVQPNPVFLALPDVYTRLLRGIYLVGHSD